MPPNNRPVDSGPGSDIHRCHSVSVVGEATRPADKLRLRFPIPLVDVSADRACSGSVLRINKEHRYARTNGFIGNKCPKLCEGPGVVKQSPSLLNCCPHPDALKILQGNRRAVPLGLLHQLLGDSVVDGAGEVSLFVSQLPQMPPGRLGATLLEASPELGKAQTNTRKGFARKAFPCAIRSQVSLAEIHTENAFGLYGLRIVHRASHRQEELSLTCKEPRGKLSCRMLKKTKLELSSGERYYEAPSEGGKGDQTLLHLQTEDTAIVTHGTQLPEGMHGFACPLCFVCVHYFANHVDSKLGRETKTRSYFPVDQGVEALPTKSFLLKSYVGGIIAGCIYSTNSVQQDLSLDLIWKELDYSSQLHATQPIESLLYKKGGVKSVFLCRLKPTVSCAQIL
jgi:hypothetical protein